MYVCVCGNITRTTLILNHHNFLYHSGGNLWFCFRFAFFLSFFPSLLSALCFCLLLFFCFYFWFLVYFLNLLSLMRHGPHMKSHTHWTLIRHAPKSRVFYCTSASHMTRLHVCVYARVCLFLLGAAHAKLQALCTPSIAVAKFFVCCNFCKLEKTFAFHTHSRVPISMRA